MGQRHQMFLIARVLPHGDPQGKLYYRCIGAYHHQWCYGRLPLRAVRRFVTLVQNKDNARIIREEIHAIQGQYGRISEEPTIPKVPCPYSAFLMASAITTDIEDPAAPYSDSGSFLSAGMGSSDGSNNDGITVIDITDPEKPSYCFVSVRGLEVEGDVPYRIPLSATEYVRAYYPIEETDQNEALEKSVLETIASLDGIPLVTPHMLFEAWPHEYRLPKDLLEETKTVDEPVTMLMPSLAHLAIGPAVERSLELNNTTEIEDIVWMASNAEAIRAILLPKDPFPDTGIALLAKVIRAGINSDVNKVINLSGFHLSPEQIVTLITKQFEDVEVLDVSNMPKLTIDTIIKVLPSVPNLRRLVLLGTSITDDEICSLLPKQAMLFRHLEALIHPFFMKHTENGYPNAFSIIRLSPDMHTIGIASLPYFTPAQALQAITDYVSPFASDDYSSILRSPIMVQAAVASEVRHPKQKWSQRTIPLFPQHSLRAFRGEGWFFALQWNGYASSRGSKYAFVKLDSDNFFERKLQGNKDSNSESLDWGALKVCDLKEFLLKMQEDDRPPPPSNAVDNLNRIIEALHVKGGLALMSTEETKEFITKVMQFNKRRF